MGNLPKVGSGVVVPFGLDVETEVEGLDAFTKDYFRRHIGGSKVIAEGDYALESPLAVQIRNAQSIVENAAKLAKEYGPILGFVATGSPLWLSLSGPFSGGDDKVRKVARFFAASSSGASGASAFPKSRLEQEKAEAIAEARSLISKWRSLDVASIRATPSLSIGSVTIEPARIYDGLLRMVGELQRLANDTDSRKSRERIRTLASDLRTQITFLETALYESKGSFDSVPLRYKTTVDSFITSWKKDGGVWNDSFEMLAKRYLAYWWQDVSSVPPYNITYALRPLSAALMRASLELSESDRPSFIFAGRRFIMHLVYTGVTTGDVSGTTQRELLSYSGTKELFGEATYALLWQRFKRIQGDDPETAAAFMVLATQYARYQRLTKGKEFNIAGHKLERDALSFAVNASRDPKAKDPRVIKELREFFADHLNSDQPSIEELTISDDHEGPAARYISYTMTDSLRGFLTGMSFTPDSLDEELRGGEIGSDSISLNAVREWGEVPSGGGGGRTREPANLQRLLWVYHVLDKRAQELGFRVDFVDYLASIYPSVKRFVSSADGAGNIVIEAPSFMFHSPMNEWSLGQWAREFKLGNLPHLVSDDRLDAHGKELVRRPTQETIGRYLDLLSSISGGDRTRLDDFLVGFLLLWPVLRRTAPVHDMTGALVSDPQPYVTRYNISVVPDGVEYESLRVGIPNVARRFLEEDLLKRVENYFDTIKQLGIAGSVGGSVLDEYFSELDSLRQEYFSFRAFFSGAGSAAAGKTLEDMQNAAEFYAYARERASYMMGLNLKGRIDTPLGEIDYVIGRSLKRTAGSILVDPFVVEALAGRLGTEMAASAVRAGVIYERLLKDSPSTPSEGELLPWWGSEAGLGQALQDYLLVSGDITSEKAGVDDEFRKDSSITTEWEGAWVEASKDLSPEDVEKGKRVIYSYFKRTRFPSKGFWNAALEQELKRAKVSGPISVRVESFIRAQSGNEIVPPRDVDEAVETVWQEYLSLFPQKKGERVELPEVLSFLAERVAITTLGTPLVRESANVLARLKRMIVENNAGTDVRKVPGEEDELFSSLKRRDEALLQGALRIFSSDDVGVGPWLSSHYERSPLDADELIEMMRLYAESAAMSPLLSNPIRAFYRSLLAPYTELAGIVSRGVEAVAAEYLGDTYNELTTRYGLFFLALEDVALAKEVPHDLEDLIKRAATEAGATSPEYFSEVESSLGHLSQILGREPPASWYGRAVEIFRDMVEPRLLAIASEEAWLERTVGEEERRSKEVRTKDIRSFEILEGSAKGFSQAVGGLVAMVEGIEDLTINPESVLMAVEQGAVLVTALRTRMSALEKEWGTASSIAQRLGGEYLLRHEGWLEILSEYGSEIETAEIGLRTFEADANAAIHEDALRALRAEMSVVGRECSDFLASMRGWMGDADLYKKGYEEAFAISLEPGFGIERFLEMRDVLKELSYGLGESLAVRHEQIKQNNLAILGAIDAVRERAYSLGVPSEIDSYIDVEVFLRVKDFNSRAVEINELMNEELVRRVHEAEGRISPSYNVLGDRVPELPPDSESLKVGRTLVTFVEPAVAVRPETVVSRLKETRTLVSADGSYIVDQKESERIAKWLKGLRDESLNVRLSFNVSLEVPPRTIALSVRMALDLPEDHPLRIYVSQLIDAAERDPIARQLIWQMLDPKSRLYDNRELFSLLSKKVDDPAKVMRRWLLLGHALVSRVLPPKSNFYKYEFLGPDRDVAVEEYLGIPTSSIYEEMVRRTDSEVISRSLFDLWLSKVRSSLPPMAFQVLNERSRGDDMPLYKVYAKLLFLIGDDHDLMDAFEKEMASLKKLSAEALKLTHATDDEIENVMATVVYHFFLRFEVQLAGMYGVRTEFTWEEQAALTQGFDPYVIFPQSEDTPISLARLQVLRYVFSQPRLYNLAKITVGAAKGRETTEPVANLLRNSYYVQARYLASHKRLLFPMDLIEHIAITSSTVYHSFQEVVYYKYFDRGVDNKDIKGAVAEFGLPPVFEEMLRFTEFPLYALILMLRSGNSSAAQAARELIGTMDVSRVNEFYKNVAYTYARYRNVVLANRALLGRTAMLPYPEKVREYFSPDVQFSEEFPEFSVMNPIVLEKLQYTTLHSKVVGVVDGKVSFVNAIPEFGNVMSMVVYLDGKRFLSAATYQAFFDWNNKWTNKSYDSWYSGGRFDMDGCRKELAAIYRRYRHEFIGALKQEEGGITHAALLTGVDDPWVRDFERKEKDFDVNLLMEGRGFDPRPFMDQERETYGDIFEPLPKGVKIHTEPISAGGVGVDMPRDVIERILKKLRVPSAERRR